MGSRLIPDTRTHARFARLLPSLDPQVVRQCLARLLSPRQEQIVRLRFGIGEKCAYTLEEVAQRFAVTRERARQIEREALTLFCVELLEWALEKSTEEIVKPAVRPL